MAESLASVRGGISQREPESCLSQQSYQPYTENIQSEHELFKYLAILIAITRLGILESCVLVCDLP